MAEGQKGKSREKTNSKVLSDAEQRTLGSTAVSEEVVSNAKETVDKIDELLDEIDDVLEINAEEFVKGYVQKGGQ